MGGTAMSKKSIFDYEQELLEKSEPIVKQLNKGWIDVAEANKRLKALSDRHWANAATEKGKDRGRKRSLVGYREVLLARCNGKTQLEAGRLVGFCGDDDYVIKKVGRIEKSACEAALAPSLGVRWRYLEALNEGYPPNEHLRFVVIWPNTLLLMPIWEAVSLRLGWDKNPPE